MNNKLNKNHLIFPICKRGRYYLDIEKKPESLLFGTLPSFLKAFFTRKLPSQETINKWHAPEPIIHTPTQPTVTWIGHATFLIQLEGMTIVTDPVFGEISRFFKRILPPGLLMNQLPTIDVILISHNHWDHMDPASLITLKKLFPNVRILVPKGDKRWFDRRGFDRVDEYVWWEQENILSQSGLAYTFTFLPSDHWSARGLFDKNKSLWGSWMIQSKDTVLYFGGDSAYHKHFCQIGQYFKQIDLAFLPIGPCEPHDWMKHTHISCKAAGQAFLDLKARACVPMHWGTFPFGQDRFEEPMHRFRTWWHTNETHTKDKTLHIVRAGDPVILL